MWYDTVILERVDGHTCSLIYVSLLTIIHTQYDTVDCQVPVRSQEQLVHIAFRRNNIIIRHRSTDYYWL